MKKPDFLRYILLPFIALFATFGLFLLDHETENVQQVLQWKWLPIYLIYAVPTYLVTLLIFQWLEKRKHLPMPTIQSVILGVPVGFALVIAVMKIIYPSS